MTDDYVSAARDLHHEGLAYSSEVWDDSELVGGGFGFVVGDVVTVESGFYQRTGASKASDVSTAVRARKAGAALVDFQWPSEHVRQVGAREVDERRLAVGDTDQGAGPRPGRETLGDILALLAGR